ncbi:24219_t:CDS:2, partial [Racocetra persica]
IDFTFDYGLDYCGIRTFRERGYMFTGIERPCYRIMLVACYWTKGDIELVKEFYERLRFHRIVPSSSMIFYACLNEPQTANCFLLECNGIDDLNKIDLVKKISGKSGGMGVTLSNVPSSEFLKVAMMLNEIGAKKIVEGNNKRAGSISVSVDVYSINVLALLGLRLNIGDESTHAPNLYTCVNLCDLFFERFDSGKMWTLFNPSDDGVSKLSQLYGDEFKKHYLSLESKYPDAKKIDPGQILHNIHYSSSQSGFPYVISKYQMFRTSNLKHCGQIITNLCTEICEPAGKDMSSVCNLLSLDLASFLIDGEFDWEEFRKCVELSVIALNNAIDLMYYIDETTKRPNLQNRPIAIGYQNLSVIQAFSIYAYVYHIVLLKRMGRKFPTYEGCDLSKGILHFQHFKKSDGSFIQDEDTVFPDEFKQLREDILKHEISINAYADRALSNEFFVYNKYLYDVLKKEGFYEDGIFRTIALSRRVLMDKGCFQNYVGSRSFIIQHLGMHRDRIIFIDHSASLNLYLSKSMHDIVIDEYYRLNNDITRKLWKLGVKTIKYYGQLEI